MLLISYGTRPEWIKIKPILSDLKIPYKLLRIGQHKDLVDGPYDLKIDVEDSLGNRLDCIFKSIMDNSEIFSDVHHVMVQGDTASAAAVALASFHRKIPVIHLEAGLRTGNIMSPYPEEFYRKMISGLAFLNLCPTHKASVNLFCEGIDPQKIHVVGNTVCDNLRDVTSTEQGKEVLITMHRRENHKDMGRWFSVINELAKNNKDLQFTLPLHPNPNVQVHRNLLTDVNVIDPIPYDEFIERLSKCRFVISDSGGIQEEAAHLKKFCIVCRENTERSEGLYLFSRLCPVPKGLYAAFKEVRDNYKVPSVGCPYGDGFSGERVANILNSL